AALIGVFLLSFAGIWIKWRDAEFQKTQFDVARLDAEKRKDEAEKVGKELRRHLYFNQVALAQRELAGGNLGRASELLDGCARDLRAWEWHYLDRRLHEALDPPFPTLNVKDLSIATPAPGTTLNVK